MVLRVTVTKPGVEPQLKPSADPVGKQADLNDEDLDTEIGGNPGDGLHRHIQDMKQFRRDNRGTLPHELPAEDELGTLFAGLNISAGEMVVMGDYPEDFEPLLRRRRAEADDLATFGEAARAAGQVPDDVLLDMRQSGALGDNETAAAAADALAKRRSMLETAGAVGKDIAKGAMETPRQIMGGMRDAVQAAINGIGAVGDWLNTNVADLDAAVGLTPKAGQKTEMPQLPGVKQAESVTGGVVRSVAQFLTGFVGAGKVLGAAGGGVTGAALKGGLADFSAFEGHEKRLSDLIQQVPALANPVTEFLASDPNDSELESRFKRSIEGLGLGALTEGLILGVKAIRASRQARSAQEAGAAEQEAAQSVQKSFDLLGDAAPDAPLVTRAKPNPTADLGVPSETAAKALTPKGLTPLGDGEAYVNFARIDSADDVKRVIQDVADAFKGQIDEARRGVRTNAETKAAAEQINAWETVLSRRKGEPLNAEQTFAVRQLWTASGEKLLQVSKAAAENPSAENLYAFRKMLATHYAIQSEVTAVRTETARALQSWAIPAGGGKTQMAAIEDILLRYGGNDVNAAFASRIAALADLPNGLAALDKAVEKGIFAKSLDVVKEVWINALLSGPKTHVVNMMSNTSVAGLTMAERWMASRYSQIFGSGEVPIGEAGALWFGMMSGIRDAFRNAATAFRTGQSGYGVGKVELPYERAISSGRLGVGEESWLGKGVDALGTVVNLPGRSLTAADEFYKSIGYRMELHAQAHRIATREVMDGRLERGAFKERIADIIENPPENIRLSAIDAAAYQTFTSQPGKWVQSLNRMEHTLEQHSPAGALGALLTRFLVPFRNTPANIMKFTFERTPLAPLMQRYRDAVAAGGAEADIARTKMALGSMAILAAMDFAFDGHVTGSGPRKGDPAEAGRRAALYRSGWRPYSVKIGDRYFAFNRLDPAGTILGLGADIAEMIQDSDFSDSTGLEIQKAVSAGIMAVGNNIMSKSWLQGMSGFVEALAGSERSASGYVEKTVASLFAPTLGAEIARFQDPYIRETHDIVSKIKSRLPGLSQDLPISRDLYGRPRTYESGLGKLYDAVSPIYSSKEDVLPIDREQMENGFYFGNPQRKVGDVSLKTKPEIFSRFLQLQGQTKPSEMGAAALVEKYGDRPLAEVLNAIVEGDDPLSAGYKQQDTPDEKKKFLMKVVGDFRTAARVQIAREFPKDFEEAGDFIERAQRKVEGKPKKRSKKKATQEE